MIKNIILHHSSAPESTPKADSSNYTLAMCNADHKFRFNMKSSLGWYVGYHYFIDKYGKVTQTRLDTEEGAHCVGYNNHPGDNPAKASIGIHLSGNFDVFLPTEAQKLALTGLLQQKVKQYNLDVKNIVPHRKYANKTCFGRNLPDNWGEKLLMASPIPLPVVTETWQDRWTRGMLASGFVIKDGKFVWVGLNKK